MPGVMGGDVLLESALKDLLQAWSETADAWRDQARADFDQQFMMPIEARARLAVRSVGQLEALLGEALRTCA